MSVNDRVLLLSIRPRYAEMILSGVKTVELRRIKPKIKKGSAVVFYVSSPVKAIIGGFRVVEVIEGSPSEVWNSVRSIAGVNREEFNEYFDGTEKAYGISIENLWVFRKPLELDFLRNLWTGFNPPQSYRYLTNEEMSEISQGNKYSQILTFPSTRIVRDKLVSRTLGDRAAPVLQYKFGF